MRGGVSVSLREILFRGKRVDSGVWSYGSLVIRKKDDGGRKYFISGFEPFSKAGEVLGETVGEYTGFRDTSGNAVFEGDVVEDLAFGVYEVAMTMWGFRAVDRKTGASYGLRAVRENPTACGGGALHNMWEKTTEEWIPNVRRVSGKEQTVCEPAQPKHW